jgi:hypothetical protein
MPIFMGIIVASLCAFLVNELLGKFSTFLGVIVSFIIWVLVFSSFKRFIKNIRPK